MNFTCFLTATLCLIDKIDIFYTKMERAFYKKALIRYLPFFGSERQRE